MAHNFTNFKYSHTIEPPKTEKAEEDEDFEALFKIGSNYIQKQSESEVQEISAASRQKKISKNSSERREKKEKKKHKKQKKDRKEKKKKERKQLQQRKREQEIEDLLIIEKSTPSNALVQIPQNKHKIVSDYFTNKAEDELLKKLNSNFAYNEKLGRDCISFCIINFPQKGLFEYGLPMNEIPQYRRVNYPLIVGMKSSKQSNKILNDLNKQLGIKEKKEEDLNQNRYFSYSNLDQIQGQTIKYIRTRPDADPHVVPFDSSYWADPNAPEVNSLKTMMVDYRSLQISDAQLLRLNRQYNTQLSKNPQDIAVWLKFIALQDHISRLQAGPKNKQGLLERKLSIVEKSLQSNPNQTKLMVAHLNILIILQRENYYNSICLKTMDYLNNHPYSTELWEIYLDFRFSNVAKFTNSFVRKQFEDITAMLRKKTSQATSASLIWKIRKASLYVLQKIMTILKLEGYNELSTGICQALLEYNIFIPPKINASNDYNFRAQVFKSYWEDYEAYRVGQLDSVNCWDGYYQDIHTKEDQNKTYIGKMQEKEFFKQNKEEKMDWVDRQIAEQRDIANWRPSHNGYDSDRIEKSPQSFVLMEDIEHLLQIYRDNENIQLLVDIVFQNMGFPPVFNKKQNPSSEFLSSYIYQKLLTTLKEQKINLLDSSQKMDLWLNYWHPLQTYIFMDDPNWQIKLLYMKRLLFLLKIKIPNKEPIMLYQMFLQIVIYTNQALIDSIYEGNLQKCKDSISNILQQDPTNIRLWICYIEGEHLKEKNTKECIGVFRQLLTFEKLSRKKIYLILYHYYSSLKRWKQNVQPALALLLGYIRDHNPADIVDKPMRPYDLLILYSLLLSRYRQFEERKNKTVVNGKQSKRHLISYFILDIATVYEPSEEMKIAMDTIANRLQSQSITDPVSSRILLLVGYKGKLSPVPESTVVDVSYLEYLMTTFRGQTFLLKSFLSKQLGDLTLTQWMICMCCYRHSYNPKLIELFFLYGQELAKTKGVYREITSTVNFCKLLSTWQPNPTFFFLAINHIPYAKHLYLLFLKYCLQCEYHKVRQVLVEKQLRLVDKSWSEQ